MVSSSAVHIAAVAPKKIADALRAATATAPSRFGRHDGRTVPRSNGPQQALEATKRLMNIQLEKPVMASLDYANLSEHVSFGTADFNKILDVLIAKKVAISAPKTRWVTQLGKRSAPSSRMISPLR
jgi:hypothetical protein